MERKKMIRQSLFTLVFTLFLFSCNGQKDDKSNEDMKVNNSLQEVPRPSNVSSKATLADTGFEDAPVYNWFEFLGVIPENKDIYKVRIYNAAGTSYNDYHYKRFNGSSFSFSEDFEISMAWGTSNLFFSNDEKKGLYLLVNHQVNGKLSYKEKTFQKVISIDEIEAGNWVDSLMIVRVRSDVFIHLRETNEPNILEAYVMDELKNGRILNYIKSDDFDCSLDVISYFDRRDGKIYFPKKDCYLTPVKE